MINLKTEPPKEWDVAKMERWAFYNYLDDLVINIIQMDDTPSTTRRIWIQEIGKGKKILRRLNGSYTK